MVRRIKKIIHNGVKFDSLSEFEFGERLERMFGTPVAELREQTILDYIVPEQAKRYFPDYTVGKVHLEYKGRFTKQDRDKLLFVQRANPGVRIIVVFQRARNYIRKGSKTTYGDWCSKNGFEWVDSSIPDRQLKRLITRKTKSI